MFPAPPNRRPSTQGKPNFHAFRSGEIVGTAIVSAYNPLYSVAGFLVGALVGLTGVGGGSLMTPLLVLLFGFPPSTAVGTDLLYASVTKTVGTAVHGPRRYANRRLERQCTALVRRSIGISSRASLAGASLPPSLPCS